MFTKEFKDFFKNNREKAKGKRRWNRYIHSVNLSMIEFHLSSNAKVLAIGPWVSPLFASPRIREGVCIDPYFEAAQAGVFPNCRVLTSLEQLGNIDEKFDYIVLSFSMGMVEDVLDLFTKLRRFCSPRTRLIATYYSRAWQPFIKVAEAMSLKLRSPEMNWLSLQEIENLMFLSDFQIIKRSMFCLAPLYIPFISDFINKFFSTLPLVNLAGVLTIEVGRALNLPETDAAAARPKVSIVIPARNEAGNIPEIVRRTPAFAGGREIIFVEGGSTDNTRGAIEQVMEDNPHLNIVCLTQEGRGKKNAVEKGFSAAKGDIFIILDADITVPPESLPRFVDAIASGKGEFVNGNRLVYPMRGKAMRFFNLLGNVFFGQIFSYLFGQRTSDTLCGTKVLKRNDYFRILANRSYFGEFDPFGDFDLLFGAAYLNLKIIDMPVRYEERAYGDTNISRWKDGFTLLKMTAIGMVKMKFNWLSMRRK
ncbi:MAG: glycosyltransferase [Elusimicrobia bacterium]|nr:glycosyltransferase [Elusimicrobiota bacterium]